MKICPRCGKQYANDLNFCLDDGSSLGTDAEQTVPFGLNVPRPTKPVDGRTERNRSEQPTAVYPAKKSKFGVIAAAVIAFLLITAGIVGYGAYSAFSAMRRTAETAAPPPAPTRTPFQPKAISVKTPLLKTDKLKVEVLGNVKGGWDQTFIKCRITNESEMVIKEPRVRLTLYKNDLKIGDASGETKLEYLKPGQSVPVWINLSNKEESYTAARPAENAEYTTFDKDADRLFPALIYSDAKMTSEEGSVLINFRSFKETYYEVKGTVENRDYDVVNAEIFLLFYGANSEIVGITSTSPPELKRGEKAAFEASMGERSLFGTPVRFELIAIDDTKKD